MIHNAPSARSKSVRRVVPLAAPVATSFGAQRTDFSGLARSREGRVLSEARYRNAENFFLAVEELRFPDTGDLLYQAGIVAQMALSSHLLDVGFDDKWCARNIGLHIGKALAYANATGLNYRSQELERLAAVLSPYNKWRNPDYDGSRPPVPASPPNIPPILRDLLDHVRGVTGHLAPVGGGLMAGENMAAHFARTRRNLFFPLPVVPKFDEFPDPDIARIEWRLLTCRSAPARHS